MALVNENEHIALRLEVRRQVSFDVSEGQIVTILGANGAGKTTVLKSVCGAMEPQKGTVTFAGRPITGREPDWVARNGIAHVPEGREIFPFMTVKGNSNAYMLKSVEKVEVVDKYTVKFTLKEPFVSFLMPSTVYVAVREGAVKNYGPNMGYDYGGRLMAAWLER